jgi:hypothetical protein
LAIAGTRSGDSDSVYKKQIIFVNRFFVKNPLASAIFNDIQDIIENRKSVFFFSYTRLLANGFLFSGNVL